MPPAARSRVCSRFSGWVGVIGVVHVRNSFCGVSSGSFLCQFENIFFH